MLAMLVTLLVSQSLMSWLKDRAAKNMWDMLVTSLVSQWLMS